MGLCQEIEKVKSGIDLSEDELFESYHLPQVPDMPIAGSGYGHKLIFRSLVVRPGLLSSTLCLVLQSVSNLSGIPDSETSGKDTDSETDGRPKAGTRSGLSPHQRIRRVRQDTSITVHSLQLVTEEFRKICYQKYKNVKADTEPMSC